MTTVIIIVLVLGLIISGLTIPAVNNFAIVIYMRLTSETPRFFKGLSRIFLTVTAVCLSIQPDVLQLINQLTNLGVSVPAYLQDIGKYAAVASLLSSIVSKLAVDRDKMNDDTYKEVS